MGKVGSQNMRNDRSRSPASLCPGLWAAGGRCWFAPRRLANWALIAAVSVVACGLFVSGVAMGQRGEPGETAGAAAVPQTPAAETAARAESDAAEPAVAAGSETAAKPVVVSPGAGRDPEAPIREIEPELYYLENDAGRLVPVPGFQYRDFVELVRLREGMPKLPTAPEAVLEQFDMRVDVRPGRPTLASESGATPPEPDAANADPAIAEVEGPGGLRIEMTVVQASTGWVGLPLELSEALFTQAPQHETLEGAAGRFLLDANADGTGYRGWFQGEPGTRHRVVLTGRLPVERSGGTVQFGIDVPRANASRLTLLSEVDDPTVAVEPAGLPPQLEKGLEGGSVVSLVGLVGPTRIRLSSERSLLEPLAAAPHATSELVVTINGRQAKTEAVIAFEHLPPGRRTITLRLPAYAKLESLAAPSGLVSLQGSDQAPKAVVSVDPDASGRAVIELICEAPVEPDGRSLEVLGFGISEIPAWRQWGQISVLVEGDWQIDWSPPGPLRRVDPSLALRRRGCVAAFAYDAQPASLPLQVRPLRSRVVVEPEYRIRVAASRVELEARLRVAVRGAPISQLRVGLEGWEVEDVGPAGLVDISTIVENAGGVDIPFVQGLSGDAVVEIRAARSVAPDAERIEWTFPTPAADLVGPATVVILPESDIELTPDVDAIDGLVRQVTSPSANRAIDPLPPLLRSEGTGAAGRAENTAIAYRLDGPSGRFAATRRFLPRRVAASLTARLDVRPTEVTVDETLRFDVAYVPLEVVELLVPESVVASGTLEVRQGDRLLASQPAAAVEPPSPPGADDSPVIDGASTGGGSGTESDAGGGLLPTVRTRVMLPTPLLGSGELTIRYRLPATPPPQETTLAEDVPLVMPAGARFGKQSVTLEAARGLSVEVRGESWKREMAVQGTALPRSWASSRPQESIRLAIAAEPQSFGETVVDAAWLQSRFLPDQRQDIYRYRIATSVERLEIDLPPGTLGESADPSRVEVLLDGRPIADAVRTDGRISLNLFTAGAVREYAVEIVVRRDRSSAWDPAELTAPVFSDGAVERRFYWELRLSPEEHLLTSPRGWTAQQEWAWGTLGFLPRAIISPEMLRTWVAPQSAATADPVGAMIPYADRRLVFSGVGHPKTARLWIVPTWGLVLACSGPSLLIGLLLVQWPRLRRPSVVMLMAIAVTAAAAVSPWLALLLAQAALPGLLLSLLAAGLRVALRLPAAAAAGQASVMIPQSSTRTALAAFVPESSRGRRSVAAERSAS